jgi:hypothetical protein
MRSQSSPLFNFSDNVSWVMGSHSFTAGWEGNWADSNGWNTFVNGFEMFPAVNLGSGAFPLNLQGRIPGLDQNAGLAESILNDLAGSVASYDQAYVVNDPSVGFVDFSTTPKKLVNFHQNDWATYFKDDWNVTQNLTLNYGIRWDVYGVPYEAKGLATAPKDGNYYGISGGALTQIIPVGKNSPNPDIPLYSKDWNNIAPSFGFSYRVPWMDRATVVRGGFGVSYSGAPTFLQYDFGPAVNVGGTAFGSVSNPSTYTALPGSVNPTAAQVSFPVAPNITVPYETPQLNGSARAQNTLFVYAPDRRIPYIMNMNLSIERELAANTNLSVSYIGTQGVSLWGGIQKNEPYIFRAQAQGETFLEAFNITRGGGDSALFQDMFKGLRLGSQTVGTGPGQVSGSTALRNWTFTDDYFANGDVAQLSEFISETNLVTGSYGGLLRANGYPENFLSLNPQFNQVDYYDNGDHSSYHSLQAQVTKRTSAGFSGQFSYTWSKALGNSATEGFRAREDQSFGTRDFRDRNLQKGRVGFDRAHAFNAHGVWSLPFGPGRLIGSNAPSVVARIIEGWQLSTIFSYGTGSPLSVTSPRQTIVGEDSRNSPNLVGGISNFPKSLGEVTVDAATGFVSYLPGWTRVRPTDAELNVIYGGDPDNLKAHDSLWYIANPQGDVVLTEPLPGTTGNLSYSWLEGPGSLGLDMAMQKSVQIREGTEFTLRMDAINMLNTPQWGDPNLATNSANFGRITGAGGNRTFTLNARIDF